MRTLCITLGDPCGLGPELVTRHFLDADAPTDRFLLIGPAPALDRELARTGAARFFTPLDSPDRITDQGPGVYIYQPPELNGVAFPPGAPCREGGLSAGVSMDAAIEVLKAGLAQGLLTCPLHKAMLNAAGFDFPGHTEFLAERLGVGRDNVCMHLCGHDPDDPSPKLRVSLVTTHPRLRDVPDLVTRERILHCLRLTDDFIRTLGLQGPIGVCGLNPHAGESGRIGDEEITTIIPALEQARAEGIDAAGPVPGDTIFHFAAKGRYPAVLAMYHDQGLAPLKLLHFSRAVNVTLGLPYPRTSPDHGTGYDLVGTGEASIDSFRAALDMLGKLVGETGVTMFRRYVLLDRDGTIIKDKHYLHDPDGVELLPQAAEGLKRMQGMGFGLAVLTNQSGVGRGYYDEASVRACNERMTELLAAEGVTIDGVFFCPHEPKDKCDCRKPKPGLMLRAAAELDFDPAQAFMIGDKAADIGLGKNTGAATILVRTGKGAKQEAKCGRRADHVCDDLFAAALYIESLM